jgi:hypothetical protein
MESDDDHKKVTTHVSFAPRYSLVFSIILSITTRGHSEPSGSGSRATDMSRKRSCSNAVGRLPVPPASFIHCAVAILCISSSNTISLHPQRVFRPGLLPSMFEVADETIKTRVDPAISPTRNQAACFFPTLTSMKWGISKRSIT